MGWLDRSLKQKQESEEKYRLIAENTADLISVLDMNLRFTYVSPASMRLHGFTAEEAMQQTLDQVLTPESMQLSLSVFEKEMQLEASGTADPDRTRILELKEYKKDGSTIWVEVNLSSLRDKDRKPVGILVVTRDISERKRTEETLMLNAQRMQALLQLNQMKEATLQEITDFALEEAVRLTQSKIGYLAFLNEDESILTMHSWSQSAMEECAIQKKPIVYPIETTGLSSPTITPPPAR
ncbi:MAG: PAS domain S-box protein [Desulfobacterales bacterium]|nr:PAS domain S-box protein [Desulfobacterales bacterium]